MFHEKKRKSISFRIILVIVLLIFPMNIYMLYSARRSQDIIIEHTTTSMKNIANLYVSELEARVQSINNFILDIEQGDRNFSDICNAEQRDNYYIAGMGLRETMEKHMACWQSRRGTGKDTVRRNWSARRWSLEIYGCSAKLYSGTPYL